MSNGSEIRDPGLETVQITVIIIITTIINIVIIIIVIISIIIIIIMEPFFGRYENVREQICKWIPLNLKCANQAL